MIPCFFRNTELTYCKRSAGNITGILQTAFVALKRLALKIIQRKFASLNIEVKVLSHGEKSVLAGLYSYYISKI